MHINKVTLHPERYPAADCYPFNLEIFQTAPEIKFTGPVTFFAGENGSGKSTFLKAICRKCGIHIWEDNSGARYRNNPYEDSLFEFMDVEWQDGPVHGSFFSSQIFHDFARYLDEWAKADPGQLEYFGGDSLLTQSHGQSLISFFSARYAIKGLYLMDEPETALSPKSQLKLLKILKETGSSGKAQFIINSHSPILLAYPDAVIYDFDSVPIKPIQYEETEYYQIYKDFMNNKDKYLAEL
jgi:predicted ATPase